MDFHKVVKYALTVLFIIVIIYAVMNKDSFDSNTPVQQPINQQPQTKFNF